MMSALVARKGSPRIFSVVLLVTVYSGFAVYSALMHLLNLRWRVEVVGCMVYGVWCMVYGVWQKV